MEISFYSLWRRCGAFPWGRAAVAANDLCVYALDRVFSSLAIMIMKKRANRLKIPIVGAPPMWEKFPYFCFESDEDYHYLPFAGLRCVHRT